jgi:hypothetical protein
MLEARRWFHPLGGLEMLDGGNLCQLTQRFRDFDGYRGCAERERDGWRSLFLAGRRGFGISKRQIVDGLDLLRRSLLGWRRFSGRIFYRSRVKRLLFDCFDNLGFDILLLVLLCQQRQKRSGSLR